MHSHRRVSKLGHPSPRQKQDRAFIYTHRTPNSMCPYLAQLSDTSLPKPAYPATFPFSVNDTTIFLVPPARILVVNTLSFYTPQLIPQQILSAHPAK